MYVSRMLVSSIMVLPGQIRRANPCPGLDKARLQEKAGKLPGQRRRRMAGRLESQASSKPGQNLLAL